MSASKTPAEVVKAMELFDVRKGDDSLPRETNPLNIIHCFDKGHFRTISAERLQNAMNDADGPYVVMGGKRISLQSVNSVFGVPLPVGFVAVPTQYILMYFTSRYSRNIIKMLRKITKHHSEFTQYRTDRFNGTDLGRPRRPTLRSLNLDKPTEFENFLRPLQSFFHDRLQSNFGNLVRTAENGQYTVFNNINRLALPDLINNNLRDTVQETRWRSAQGEYVAVKIGNFDTLLPAPAPTYAAPQLVFPPNAPPPPVRPGAPLAAVPLTPIEIDEQMLEQCSLGLNTKWKRVFLYMTPWNDALPVPTPFVSREYRLAYAVAQAGFAARYAEFKSDMVAKRKKHAREWREYSLYRNEMKSVFMLDSKRVPVTPYAERPQVEHFTEEWKQFAFGLKEEMKNFVFLPVRVPVVVGAPPPGFVGGRFNGFAANVGPNVGPNVERNVKNSSSLSESAKRMFLI